MERVGFGPRFGAALLDGIINLVIIGVILTVIGGGSVMAALGLSGGSPDAAAVGAVGGLVFSVLIAVLISIGYSTFDVFMAGTPGKQALKLRIRNNDGSVATPSTLWTRWAIKNSGNILRLLSTVTTITFLATLGSIVGFVIFVGFFLVLGADRLALHDKLAKTAVYKAEVAA